MITLARLRELAEAELGPGLCRADPLRVRAFLDRVQLLSSETPPGGRYTLEGPARTYDEIMRRYFWRVLDSPSDDAVVQLWLLAAEAYLTVTGAPEEETE